MNRNGDSSAVAVNQNDVASGLAIDFEPMPAEDRDDLPAAELTQLRRQTETLTLSVDTSAGIGSPRSRRLSMCSRIASAISERASSSDSPSV